MNRRGEPFYSYGSYLKDKYGDKVYRIGVDTGFSCPNRGKNRLKPGCTYCDEMGSRAPYLGDEQTLKKQVENAMAFLKRRYHARMYILYMQAFSNTFASVKRLKEIYDYALSLAPFKEFIVSTRPDCIDGEKVDLLSSYMKTGIDVWVELGLQSSHEKTLKLINRGHGLKSFERAFSKVKERGIKVAIHIIFGLPGENREDIMDTIKYIAKMKPDGIKIHNLHIPFDTVLYMETKMGEITQLSDLRHASYTVEALRRIPPQTIVMRITTDTLKGKLALPKSFMGKADFYSLVRKTMMEKGLNQGDMYREDF